MARLYFCRSDSQGTAGQGLDENYIKRDVESYDFGLKTASKYAQVVVIGGHKARILGSNSFRKVQLSFRWP